jgi:signal transduction histidine kinase
MRGAIFWTWYHSPFLTGTVLISSLIFLTPIFLNKFHHYTLSRLFLSIGYPIFVTGLALLSKKYSGFDVNPTQFFNTRFILVACSIIPLTIFRLEERRLLIPALVANIVILFLFDPLHSLVGFSYEHVATDPNYTFAANFFPVIAILFTAGSMFILKHYTEQIEGDREKLIQQLHDSNAELAQQKEEIELRNIEIMAQSEELTTNQEQLLNAFETISDQKVLLEKQTEQLEGELWSKNRDLTETNKELTKYNEELRQFSYTISHNLRGPVARILGLTQLLSNFEKDIPEDLKLYSQLIHKSTEELDGVIKDLHKIIDIRNEIYRIREKVFFQDEWDKVMVMLKPSISEGMNVKSDFTKAPFIYTIRPIIHSAFYNLLNNAIKYRSPQRPLEVSISSQLTMGYLFIRVSDNGLGMDLKRYGKDIFTMYRRFHNHVDGKGLGLYLVKSQLESLGGKISVESELNKGTTFTLTFKVTSDIQEQIFYSNEFAVISYNAQHNFCVLTWKKAASGDDYKGIYLKCVEMLRIYNTPSWLTDSVKLGKTSSQDLDWMIFNILTEGKKMGLKRIGNIQRVPEELKPYLESIREKINSIGLQIEYFDQAEDAYQWLKVDA